MNECIFCKIVRKELAAYVFYEDEKVIAFLDINPRSKGMSLVVPKKHYANFDDDLLTSIEVVKRAMLIAKAIKEALGAIFVDIAIMPSQIPHFHVRLYPIYDFKKDFPLIENKPMTVTEAELNDVWQKLKSIEIEIEEEKKEEKTVQLLPKKELENKAVPTNDVGSANWEWIKKKFARG